MYPLSNPNHYVSLCLTPLRIPCLTPLCITYLGKTTVGGVAAERWQTNVTVGPSAGKGNKALPMHLLPKTGTTNYSLDYYFVSPDWKGSFGRHSLNASTGIEYGVPLMATLRSNDLSFQRDSGGAASQEFPVQSGSGSSVSLLAGDVFHVLNFANYVIGEPDEDAFLIPCSMQRGHRHGLDAPEDARVPSDSERGHDDHHDGDGPSHDNRMKDHTGNCSAIVDKRCSDPAEHVWHPERVLLVALLCLFLGICSTCCVMRYCNPCPPQEKKQYGSFSDAGSVEMSSPAAQARKAGGPARRDTSDGRSGIQEDHV
jgi:hypothetical protein